MRIQLIGKPFKYPGKTLWEIIGNLKNFGVGRLLKQSNHDNISEPCYFKIVRVQPIPPPRQEYEDRNVIVWVEEVYRGKKQEVRKICEKHVMPFYQLIPKHEEEKLTLQKIDLEAVKKVFYKYTQWPPLYQRLWEAEYLKRHNVPGTIPKLETLIPPDVKEGVKVSEEKEHGPLTTTFLKLEAPVEELLKEIVRLRKLEVKRSLS